MLKNTEETYGALSKFFHWVMAIIIIAMLLSSYWMMGLEPTPFKWSVYKLHKSLGVFLLIILIARFSWRLNNKTPKMPEGIPSSEALLASIFHNLLYFLMLAMPLSGYIMSTTGGHGVEFFGLPLPSIVNVDKDLSKIARNGHTIISYLLYGFITLHILAACYHHYFRKNIVLTRMLPFQK